MTILVFWADPPEGVGETASFKENDYFFNEYSALKNDFLNEYSGF